MIKSLVQREHVEMNHICVYRSQILKIHRLPSFIKTEESIHIMSQSPVS